MSLNKCLIIGNLGRDPEMRYTAAGIAVTQFSVAVNRNSRDESGEWREETEWFRVVVFREAGERAAERLRKGSKVFVEGRIQTRQYERDGQTRYLTELIAERVVPLDRRERDEADESAAEGGRVARSAARPAPAAPSGDRLDDDLDSIPF